MASLTQAKNIHYESQPVTIYDTVHIPPGATVAKEIRFSFGADISDGEEFKSLIELKEHDLTRTLLEHPLLCEKLFAPLGLTFPKIWILVEPLTRVVAPSWPQREPGDLDIICGHVEKERIVLDELNCLQIKIRRLRGGNARSYWSLPSACNRQDGIRPDSSCPHAAQRTRTGQRRCRSKLESYSKLLFHRLKKGYFRINEKGIWRSKGTLRIRDIRVGASLRQGLERLRRFYF